MCPGWGSAPLGLRLARGLHGVSGAAAAGAPAPGVAAAVVEPGSGDESPLQPATARTIAAVPARARPIRVRMAAVLSLVIGIPAGGRGCRGRPADRWPAPGP